MTNRCNNITFPQTSFAGGKNSSNKVDLVLFKFQQNVCQPFVPTEYHSKDNGIWKPGFYQDYFFISPFCLYGVWPQWLLLSGRIGPMETNEPFTIPPPFSYCRFCLSTYSSRIPNPTYKTPAYSQCFIMKCCLHTSNFNIQPTSHNLKSSFQQICFSN